MTSTPTLRESDHSGEFEYVARKLESIQWRDPTFKGDGHNVRLGRNAGHPHLSGFNEPRHGLQQVILLENARGGRMHKEEFDMIGVQLSKAFVNTLLQHRNRELIWVELGCRALLY
jgi:hypothetical protein